MGNTCCQHPGFDYIYHTTNIIDHDDINKLLQRPNIHTEYHFMKAGCDIQDCARNCTCF